MVTETSNEAERIKGLMARLGLNQADAAAYLGVPQSTLSNWLTGNREPNKVLVRLLDVLGTIEALAPGVHAALIPARRERGRG